MMSVHIPSKSVVDMNSINPLSLLLNESPEGRDSVNGGKTERRKKKRRAADAGVKKFHDLYESTGESLGEGSFGQVQTYRHISTKKEFAIKVVQKENQYRRRKVLKEIEIFHYCHGHENILQLVEYFEEEDQFFLVFEKMDGGSLLDSIRCRGHLTEQEASLVIRDIARGLDFLHKKGIAHRDLKPENILCVKAGQLSPVKICDFDLGSGVHINSTCTSPVTTPELLSPVGSADFMAPEVVSVWVDQAWSYDKRCDLWSLGIILYILLSGNRPFYANCGQDCGFNDGYPCDVCQDLLFQSIQDGVFSFPESEWSGISSEAKDLVCKLLVKNPNKRYSAEQVLRHPWVLQKSSELPLATPSMLSRNNSLREIQVFAGNANAVNRLLSITEACGSTPVIDGSKFLAWNEDEVVNDECCLEERESPFCDVSCDGGSHLSEVLFKMSLTDEEDEDDDAGIGRMSDVEEFDISCRSPVFSSGLEMPGKSNLARRRASKCTRQSISSIDSGNVCSPPNSPPSNVQLRQAEG